MRGFMENLRSTFVFSRLVATAAIACAAAACGPAVEAPGPAEVAAFFGISDGARFAYRNESGATEEHTYIRNTTFADKEAFDREVRRGGFLQDDAVFTVEATMEGLSLIRFFDCLRQCGVTSAPIPMLSWPLVPGERLSSTVTVTIDRDGAIEEQEQTHAFQLAGAIEEVQTSAGAFDGYRLIWTRTIAGATETSQLVFVPDVGFVVNEWFDGVRFELE